jgi:hypothetical protein
VYDFIEHDDAVFIIYEFVFGCPLRGHPQSERAGVHEFEIDVAVPKTTQTRVAQVRSRS